MIDPLELLRMQRDLSVSLSGTRDISEALDTVLDALTRIEPLDCGGIYLLDRHSGELDLTAHRGLNEVFVEQGARFGPDTPESALVKAGAPVYGSYGDVAPSEIEAHRREGLRALAVVPILHHGRVVAALNLASHTRDEIPEEGRRAVEAVASILGGTLARLRMEQELQQELEARVEERTAALREQEAMYRTLVERSLQGMVVVQDDRIVFVNEAFAKITGYPVETLLQFDLRKAMTLALPDERAMVAERLSRRLAGEPVPDFYESFRFLRGDGSLRWGEVLASRIDYHGRPAVQGVIIDITERKRAEDERVRTQRLQSLGVLAGGIAHDFNNLLLAILGNVSVARMDLGPDHAASGPLMEAENAIGRAESLTQQLLTFAKGGAPIREPVPVGNLVREAARFALSGTRARCEFQIAPDLWPVDADRGQLGQLISNLVINADQAMPDGGTIHIAVRNTTRTESPPERGRYVELTVEDHGIGIPREHLSRIFDPYFSTKQAGSGLGLAVAHSIVVKHQGHIEVDSQLGRGSTFRVYLPAGGEARGRPTRVDGARAVAPARILVMDDAPALRDLLCRMLTRAGHECVSVADGVAAVASYREELVSGRPFDVVILDLTVPGGMGGGEALAKLREVDADVTAIVSSGYSNDPVLADHRSYGFRGLIAKPYLPEDLLRVVEAVLEERNRTG